MQHAALSSILLAFPPFLNLHPSFCSFVNVVFAQCAIFECMCACCIKIASWIRTWNWFLSSGALRTVRKMFFVPTSWRHKQLFCVRWNSSFVFHQNFLLIARNILRDDLWVQATQEFQREILRLVHLSGFGMEVEIKITSDCEQEEVGDFLNIFW